MIQKVILTGGAGVGKTTLLDLFKSRGYPVITESGREIYVSEQMKAKETSGYAPNLPSTNYLEFEELVIKRQLEKEKGLSQGVYFLDRSLVDCLGMSIFQRKLLRTNVPQLIKKAGYFHKVFLLSPLDSYERDEQRRENKKEMLKMHKILRETYLSKGFDVVDVPAMSPEERVNYILDKLRIN
jgi:predicted ATPase